MKIFELQMLVEAIYSSKHRKEFYLSVFFLCRCDLFAIAVNVSIHTLLFRSFQINSLFTHSV
jgi:hypothetical protein